MDTALLTITELLANHEDIDHAFEVELGQPAEDLAEEFLGRYLECMIGTSPTFALSNPAVAYGRAHIIGLQIDVHGQAELAEAIARAQRRVGFTTSP